MPDLSAFTVPIELRSHPAALRYLIDQYEDSWTRVRLAMLGRWEVRIGDGPWEPFGAWRLN